METFYSLYTFSPSLKDNCFGWQVCERHRSYPILFWIMGFFIFTIKVKFIWALWTNQILSQLAVFLSLVTDRAQQWVELHLVGAEGRPRPERAQEGPGDQPLRQGRLLHYKGTVCHLVTITGLCVGLRQLKCFPGYVHVVVILLSCFHVHSFLCT